ncbi:MAG: sensor domain-containing diguanylate cyclase [Gammaproteobacteria bacterium]|nr:sensor domain-containing diguanylate cyclase [Gammaproteobacteria bacterium]MBT8110751.1 sensor domain-containing diguanylate cyclase [Gammaproteobacteria bacterium]NND46626.1 sensor domain-containing diguanylate cyclase [Woeseiaceae bacterium]NNL45450.1 sensor domain-containing diguanylate cyclase [Woeseiaceae bacterium]
MESVDELMAELEATRRRLDEVTSKVASNDEKMRQTHRRELRLLQAETLDALIFALTEGLRVSYGLEHVSLVLCDPDHDIRHLLLANGTPAEDFGQLLMVEAMTGLAPQYISLRRPWLGAFAPCDHQLICPGAVDIRSIAIIPLTHRQKLLGSINLCSADLQRFTPAHATDFLAHLGVIASFCVENAINRARLMRSGFTDVLTGWHNRRYLTVRLGEELARARRDGARLVCLMLDIDHFKRVNDNWGHAAGDAVLREIAQRIESQVRASDVAARYGGEEFVVLLPGTDVASALLLAERIRESVSAKPIDLPNGEAVTITASIGISEVQPAPEAEDLKTLGDSLIARADVALYAAKAAGRDRVIVEAA